MTDRWIAIPVLALLVCSGPAFGGQKRCKGTKKVFAGRCLYPDEIRRIKRKRASRGGATSRGRANIVWVYSRPARLQFTRTEVTVGQFRACVNSGACKHGTFKNEKGYCNWGHTGRERYPMNCVNLQAARDFCRWAGGRLPSSKEWLAEATNNGTRDYPWGNSKANCARAIMDGNMVGSSAPAEDGCNKDRTWPVCSKRAGNSVSGLCDMCGNVWEHTSTMVGSKVEMRGSGWLSVAGKMKPTVRDLGEVTDRDTSDGIRCVRASR